MADNQLTENDGEDDIKSCLRWGIYDYLTKPFNPISLKAKIETVLLEKADTVLN